MDVDSTRSDERLRRLEAVTDATLSRLDASDLLDELLDPHSGQLVATAAKGIEEEVRRGVRIAIGRGFAGRVAATRRPLILNEVSRDNVVNPILLDLGIRSLLGVPILAAGDVIGVL